MNDRELQCKKKKLKALFIQNESYLQIRYQEII